jgi:hypothetical protein
MEVLTSSDLHLSSSNLHLSSPGVQHTPSGLQIGVPDSGNSSTPASVSTSSVWHLQPPTSWSLQSGWAGLVSQSPPRL